MAKPDALAIEWYLGSLSRVRQALSSRLDRREDIDDLAQEVYLRLLRVPQLDLVQNPQAYLYRVALNVAQEWRQRAAQSLDHGVALDGLIAEDDPLDEVMRAELDANTYDILKALPLTLRTALILHVIDGLTYEQVAEHMGVSRRAVKRYVAIGYASLRDRLSAPEGPLVDDRPS
jgi:RNA polymerase sigma factor (sigma-70 family)